VFQDKLILALIIIVSINSNCICGKHATKKYHTLQKNNAVFNQQSIESYLSKVKELNPKKIHLFKNILEEKTGNIIGD